MVTNMSSPMRLTMNKEEDQRRSLVTRDFLGGLRPSNSDELDLNLLRGKAHLDNRRSEREQLYDLNLLPPCLSNSDLKLGPAAPRLNYQSVCTLDKVRSALERAERDSRSGGGGKKHRSDGGAGGGASTSSSTTTTSSVRRKRGGGAEGEEGESYDSLSSSSLESGAAAAGTMMLAGCPRCLLYVLVCKGNPKCPRCGAHVPVAVLESKKRSRIDLNANAL